MMLTIVKVALVALQLCAPLTAGIGLRAAVTTHDANNNNRELYTRDTICELPAQVGPCRARIPRWYHNSATGQCEPFTYGGCDGNPNNFETEQGCHQACGGVASVCELPASSGPCYAHMPRWFFNSETGTCEEFIYGGCQGNANNFLTADECHDACHDSS